jgi:hypothetical protein
MILSRADFYKEHVAEMPNGEKWKKSKEGYWENSFSLQMFAKA